MNHQENSPIQGSLKFFLGNSIELNILVFCFLVMLGEIAENFSESKISSLLLNKISLPAAAVIPNIKPNSTKFERWGNVTPSADMLAAYLIAYDQNKFFIDWFLIEL